ncbi:MAG TPA: hypothetical protein VGN16_04090 [Acidobacteriaceae bacterium]
MKKVVLASLLAVAGIAPLAQTCYAQTPAAGSGQAQAAGGQIQMSADEYKSYNDCSTATGAAKTTACEAYLKAYPNSAVKADVLNILLYAYSQANDTAHSLDAADRLLQVDPNNLRALTLEVYLRRAAADAMDNPAVVPASPAKQAALDTVAGLAQKGLAATAPANMPKADFDTLKAAAMPTFESAIADDALAKKDNATAISALRTEIDTAPLADTQKPSPVLQDMLTLANAYYTSATPDYLNCAWYAARAGAYAPDALKPQINPLVNFCYSKFHGSKEGIEKLQAATTQSLDLPPACPPPPPPGSPAPPAKVCLTVTPAPKPADIVQNLIATTPDLAALAVSDREFVLQYGATPDPKCTPTADAPCVTNADKAFNSVKGKSVQFPDVQVISATPDKITVAVSDDAVANKTADFEFDLKEPFKATAANPLPAPGSKITLTGTYASYTSSPLLIVMSDAEVVVKKAPAKAPVHHTPARPAARRH